MNALCKLSCVPSDYPQFVPWDVEVGLHCKRRLDRNLYQAILLSFSDFIQEVLSVSLLCHVELM